MIDSTCRLLSLLVAGLWFTAHAQAANSPDNERIQGIVAEQDATLASIREGKGTANQSNAALAAQVEQLQSELAALQAISKNAVAEHADNRKLQDLNERLRNEVNDLAEQRDALRANAQQRWLLIGAGLVLLGLVLGVMIKARPRRSAWS